MRISTRIRKLCAFYVAHKLHVFIFLSFFLLYFFLYLFYFVFFFFFPFDPRKNKHTRFRTVINYERQRIVTAGATEMRFERTLITYWNAPPSSCVYDIYQVLLTSDRHKTTDARTAEFFDFFFLPSKSRLIEIPILHAFTSYYVYILCLYTAHEYLTVLTEQNFSAVVQTHNW